VSALISLHRCTADEITQRWWCICQHCDGVAAFARLAERAYMFGSLCSKHVIGYRWRLADDLSTTLQNIEVWRADRANVSEMAPAGVPYPLRSARQYSASVTKDACCAALLHALQLPIQRKLNISTHQDQRGRTIGPVQRSGSLRNALPRVRLDSHFQFGVWLRNQRFCYLWMCWLEQARRPVTDSCHELGPVTVLAAVP
jgi:hypothetical protein